jgi:hypothetical protein
MSVKFTNNPEDEEGAIIFLDQQKAFDRVEWGWIDLCFEKFGFSDCFGGWVKMLSKNAKASIQTKDLYPGNTRFSLSANIFDTIL